RSSHLSPAARPAPTPPAMMRTCGPLAMKALSARRRRLPHGAESGQAVHPHFGDEPVPHGEEMGPLQAHPPTGPALGGRPMVFGCDGVAVDHNPLNLKMRLAVRVKEGAVRIVELLFPLPLQTQRAQPGVHLHVFGET